MVRLVDAWPALRVGRVPWERFRVLWAVGDACGSQRRPDGWEALLAPVVGFLRLGQHERAVVQKRYRLQAVLLGSVVGDLAVEHLVSVEF